MKNKGGFMSLKYKVWIPVVFLIALTGQVPVEGGPKSQQQEMDKVFDMLKQQGIDSKQLEGIENMMRGQIEKDRRRKDAKLRRAQQRFEEEMAGHGEARVDLDGMLFHLKVIRCEINDRNTGHLLIQADQAPGFDNARLTISGGHARGNIQFHFGKRSHFEVSNPTLLMTGRNLDWKGMVEDHIGKVPMNFHLTCGKEMMDFAQASQSNPQSSANVLTLKLGNKTHTFQTDYCSTKEYRTGNLIVEFDATGTGTFRGRPAILFLSKSHPVKQKQYFHTVDLLLGELTPEQRTLPPYIIQKQLEDKVNHWAAKETKAVQEKYPDKKFNSLPPDEFQKVLQQKMDELDQVNDKVNAMRYPMARSRGGTITVDGQEVHYGGRAMYTSDAKRAPEFKDLSGQPEIWVTCGN